MKQSVTVGIQLLWGDRYGCNNGRYGCTIVMSYIEINKAVSQWLFTFNLCVSATWPLTCAFHIPCTHTPEIIDMHRGVCDNAIICVYEDMITGNVMQPLDRPVQVDVNNTHPTMTNPGYNMIQKMTEGNNTILKNAWHFIVGDIIFQPKCTRLASSAWRRRCATTLTMRFV